MAALGRSYLADLGAEDALEVAFVRSPYPHAAILDIRGAGVTAADLGLEGLAVEGPGLFPRPWPPLARDRVRFVGEAVAAVWAGDRYCAEDLASQVEVEFEPLEMEEPQTLFEYETQVGEVEEHFAQAPTVLERTYQAARQAPLPLEARGILAFFAEGRLTVWSSTQVPDILRQGLIQALGQSDNQMGLPRQGRDCDTSLASK